MSKHGLTLGELTLGLRGIKTSQPEALKKGCVPRFFSSQTTGLEKSGCSYCHSSASCPRDAIGNGHVAGILTAPRKAGARLREKEI